MINSLPIFLVGVVLGTGGVTTQAISQKYIPASKAEVQMSFAPLVKKVAPAVVNIFTRKTVRSPTFSPLFDDPFFRRFFGRDFRIGPRKQRKVQNSLGSGVIVGSDGTIITNHHVIAGADEITVVLPDRTEFDAKILGSDERTDLAILRVNPEGRNLPYLSFRDSDDLEVGDLVLAIGNPFGVGQTVTSGIVSALARTQIGINDFNFFIQTDAAINPGNSGGALVTLDGKLVGVNSAIYSKSGGSVGIGFAIPSNMVRSVLRGITTHGRIIRPWVGIEGQPVNTEIANSMGLKRPIGMLINNVYPKSPADKAGIRVGDVILKLNGREINDQEGLEFRIATKAVGDRVLLKTIHRGNERDIELVIIAPPFNPKPNRTDLNGLHPLQGVTVANLSPGLLDELGITSMQRGVIILKLIRGRVANRLGFRFGDIILEINGFEVNSVARLKELVSYDSDTWKVLIKRRNEILSLVIPR